MEEIYKPEDKEADKVELYNRENNDILGDMPNWLIHTGSHIIYGLIGLLIIFAALFSYPDTVKTGVTIDDLYNKLQGCPFYRCICCQRTRNKRCYLGTSFYLSWVPLCRSQRLSECEGRRFRCRSRRR